MTTSEFGIGFIKSWELYRGQVYNDNGRPAIGYGHDLQPGEAYPQGLSLEGADLLLRRDLPARYEPAVNLLIVPACNQNQFDSLASFTYNEGVRALAIMMHHGWQHIPVQMLAWHWKHANGIAVEDKGLLKRRQAEQKLFLTI